MLKIYNMSTKSVLLDIHVDFSYIGTNEAILILTMEEG